MASFPFNPFGTAHCSAIAVTILAAILLTWYGRKSKNAKTLSIIRYTLGAILILSVSLDPILTLAREGLNAHGWAKVKKDALPFYLCDVVSLILAFALFRKSSKLTEIGYLWAVAGTTQGLITPTLGFGPAHPEFYAFFLQHGGAPIAAIFLIWGLRIAPQNGAFKRAVIWSFAYVATIVPLNWLIGENYGFLNGLPPVPTLFDHMGPWPYYLITLHIIAYTLYFILLQITPKPKQACPTTKFSGPTTPKLPQNVS